MREDEDASLVGFFADAPWVDLEIPVGEMEDGADVTPPEDEVPRQVNRADDEHAPPRAAFALPPCARIRSLGPVRCETRPMPLPCGPRQADAPTERRLNLLCAAGKDSPNSEE